EWMLADYSAPHDVLTDRLINAAVIRVGDEHYYWYSCSHHIALDGYGAVMLLSRIAERYTALVGGVEPADARIADLRALNATEDEYRGSSRAAKDREYWLAKAADLPAPVTLAVRAGEMDSRSRVAGGALPARLTEGLRDAAARLDTADTAITIAALAAFLARMTDTTDLVLSLPVSARTNAVLRRSGGMISNVVPLRFSVGATTSLRELVSAAQLELTGALRHQRYRAEDLRRDIGNGSARGFYGPALNIMNFAPELVLGELAGRFHILSTGPVEDLSVNIYPSENGCPRVDFEGNPNRYTDAELRAHYGRFLDFLAALLDADPATPVDLAEVLDVAERAALVPATGGAGPDPILLPEILAAGVAANPDGVALVAGERTVSYRELDACSNRVARILLAHGAGPETFVAVAFPRSLEAITAVWAIAKTGAAFVPVDPNHPAERITHMLTDSGAGLGLTLAGVRDGMPDTDTTWLCLDTLDTLAVPAEPVTDDERVSSLRTEHPAYVIYTSGSTGLPKGVVVTHTGLGSFTANGRPELGTTRDS
uniref:AMP-binding protein n=1 Tax=Aldersonia kunmingensis TaxID=408066 RepID=UPI000B21E78D